jgi:phage terminase large subunit-like protein
MLTRGGRVIQFIEKFCRVPEAKGVGQPLRLLEFQKRFVLDVYDNPAGTSRAYLSVGRKNGKSALIAAILLAHIAGPEARQNSQIISGARSRDQASLVFRLASKMIRLSPELSRVTRIVPSQKTIEGLARGVEYKAISADAQNAHGLSPVLAILDEVGQVRGPEDDFVEAIETAQGAYDDALLLAISTQAPTAADLFSTWLDDAATGRDASIVSHVYAAPEGCDVMDREAWRAANPALGFFRSLPDMEKAAKRAERLPSQENSFRWLFLNQRVNANAPLVTERVFASCAGPVAESFDNYPVFCGLDLAKAAGDMTAFVMVAEISGKWHVKPYYWLPGEGLPEKARMDRAGYMIWHKQGYLETTPGTSVDYDFVATRIANIIAAHDVRAVAYDPHNWSHMRAALRRAGHPEEDLPLPQMGPQPEALFQPFRQGFISMSPAVTVLETAFLDGKIAHGGHPILEYNAKGATVVKDAAGNRKLDKSKSTGRIDGMVALAMAMSVAGAYEAAPAFEYMGL